MKSIICVCLFMVAFVRSDQSLPPLPEDGSCVLDQSYQDGCNICKCFGEKALLCKGTEDCTDKVNKAAGLDGNKEIDGSCKQGEIKNGPLGDCEICICSVGVWSCDKKNCIYNNRRKRGIGTIPDLKSTPCAPNDSFRLDCNTCYCNSAKSGYRCTEHICASDNASEILIAQNTTDNVSFNVSSEIVETTPTTLAVSSTGSSATVQLTTPSVQKGVVTSSEQHIVPTDTNSTSASSGNGTAENSVLSLG